MTKHAKKNDTTNHLLRHVQQRVYRSKLSKWVVPFAITTLALLIDSLSDVHGNGEVKVPVAVGSISPVRLGVESKIKDVSNKFKIEDVSNKSKNTNRDTLTYTVKSSADTIATAHVDGSKVTIRPEAAGDATITVTATNTWGLTATQTIAVNVSQAPEAVGSIPTVRLGANSETVDVSDKFRDADGDTLTYTVKSSAATIATAHVDGSKVTIRPMAAGDATITVTARDSLNLTATQTIAVNVSQAPEAVGSIPTVRLGANSETVDVSDKFRDADGDTLTYTAVLSVDSIVTSHMDGSKVTIRPESVVNATITVTARDSLNLTATQTIEVRLNQAPVAEGRIAPVRLGANDSTDVDVSNNFKDADGDVLTYTVESNADTIATARMDSSKVKIRSAKTGYATITVTAMDILGLTATQDIFVTPPTNPVLKIISVSIEIGIGGLLLRLLLNLLLNFDILEWLFNNFNIARRFLKFFFSENKVQQSKYELRRLQCSIGALGIALPILLTIASFSCIYATTAEDSISDCFKGLIGAYHDSEIRDVVIGILYLIGTFLFVYKGYDAKDNQLSHLAGLSAVGIAFFPVISNNGTVEAMHYLSATLLFLVLAYIARYRFTKSKSESIQPGTPKAKRNQVYKWCAYMMIFALLAIGAFKCLKLSVIKDYKMMSATVLLLILIYFFLNAYFLWYSTEKAKQTKKIAHVIIFGLFAIGVGIWAQYHLTWFPFMFVTETMLFLAFGILWLVKSDALTLLRNDE